jgi:hypothetical protein
MPAAFSPQSRSGIDPQRESFLRLESYENKLKTLSIYCIPKGSAFFGGLVALPSFFCE